MSNAFCMWFVVFIAIRRRALLLANELNIQFQKVNESVLS